MSLVSKCEARKEPHFKSREARREPRIKAREARREPSFKANSLGLSWVRVEFGFGFGLALGWLWVDFGLGWSPNDSFSRWFRW